MSFLGKVFGKGFKNILGGIAKVTKKAMKNPLIRTLAIGAAAYFLMPYMATALSTGMGGFSLTAGTVAADVATGALTGAIVNGGAALISGEKVGKAAATGGLMGGATAGLAGMSGMGHVSNLKPTPAALPLDNGAGTTASPVPSLDSALAGSPTPPMGAGDITTAGTNSMPAMDLSSPALSATGTSSTLNATGNSTSIGAKQGLMGKLGNWYGGLDGSTQGMLVMGAGQATSGIASGYAAGKQAQEQARQFDLARQDGLTQYNASQLGAEQFLPADQLRAMRDPTLANQAAINPANNLNGLLQGYTNPAYSTFRRV